MKNYSNNGVLIFSLSPPAFYCDKFIQECCCSIIRVQDFLLLFFQYSLIHGVEEFAHICFDAVVKAFFSTLTDSMNHLRHPYTGSVCVCCITESFFQYRRNLEIYHPLYHSVHRIIPYKDLTFLAVVFRDPDSYDSLSYSIALN